MVLGEAEERARGKKKDREEKTHRGRGVSTRKEAWGSTTPQEGVKKNTHSSVPRPLFCSLPLLYSLPCSSSSHFPRRPPSLNVAIPVRCESTGSPERSLHYTHAQRRQSSHRHSFPMTSHSRAIRVRPRICFGSAFLFRARSWSMDRWNPLQMTHSD